MARPVSRPAAVRMADISAKAPSVRTAVAKAEVYGGAEVLTAIRDGRLAKGDALTIAKVAGIQAAKRTAELIPLCHPLRLAHVEVAIEVRRDHIEIIASVKAEDRTGVEMEALTAAAVAALALYDLGKPVDRGMEIRRVRLLSKTGGKSGAWVRNEQAPVEASGDA